MFCAPYLYVHSDAEARTQTRRQSTRLEGTFTVSASHNRAPSADALAVFIYMKLFFQLHTLMRTLTLTLRLSGEDKTPGPHSSEKRTNGAPTSKVTKLVCFGEKTILIKLFSNEIKVEQNWIFLLLLFLPYSTAK